MSTSKIKHRVKLLILEATANNSDIEISNVILFENKQWKKYVLLGGRVDKSDKSHESALAREIKEETYNLLDISEILKLIPYIDFNSNNENVRVYFIVMKKGLFDDKLYSENKNKLIQKESKVPKDWKEMSNCDRFSINCLLNEWNNTNINNANELFFCTNTRGQQKPIYPIIVKYLQKAKETGLLQKLINDGHIFKNFVKSVDNSETFLNGTSIITVNN